MIIITDENLDLLSTGNWLVKFGARWSGHCKKYQPEFDMLAQHYNSDIENSIVKVAQVFCEDYISVCNKYDVFGYPTVLFLSEGKTNKDYRGPREFNIIIKETDEYFK
ncbi:hypothetical protein ACTFIR_008329 [Dictyostelium discoideum]